MRKTILTALVVLLVMLAVSCDNIPTGQKLEYTEDGRQLVTLNVNTGGTVGSRSLTDLLAKGQDRKYVEVIFKDEDGVYWRGEGFLGTNFKVQIPVGTYTSADAILLIGKKADGTLLATGTLTGAPVTVAADTITVSFNAVSLEADIHADTGTNFVIDPTSGSPTAIEDSAFDGKILLGSFDGDTCFQVPTSTSGIEATLTITGFTATGDNIFIVESDPSEDPPVKFFNLSGSAITSYTVTPAYDDVTPAVTAVGNGGEFKITFSSPASSGEHVITFNIPVVGFDADDTDIPGRLTWYIRGGTKPGFDFTGGGEDSIVLLVSASPKKVINVGITTPSYP